MIFLKKPLSTTVDKSSATKEGGGGLANLAEGTNDGLIESLNNYISIVCSCLDTLKNYIPNLCDLKYNSRLDGYSMLLSIHLGRPSIDSFSALSFGSFLSMIEFCFESLQKVY